MESYMKKFYAYFLIGSAAGVMAYFSFINGMFSGLEIFFEDLLFSQKPVSGDIIIVSIDDESLGRFGQWPWPRKIFSEALLKMNEKSPAGVGIDAVFSEPSRIGAEDDRFFSEALSRISYPVILAAEGSNMIFDKENVSATGFIEPLNGFKNQKNVFLGHINLIADRDGVVRRFPVQISDKAGGKKIESFASVIVRKSGKEIINQKSLDVVNKIIFAAPPGQIKRIPFWRIFEDSEALNALQNKIIIIGATAPDLHDSKPTPFSKEKEMAGAEIQANIINMLLAGYRLNQISLFYSFLWIFMAAVIPSFVFFVKKRALTPLFANFFIGIIHLIAIVVLFQKGTAANIIHINFSWILSTASLFGYRYFTSEKEKKELKNIFSKYVSSEVVAKILENPEKIALGGEEKEITVLFSDIRGFTSLSEKLPPKKLVEILNRYFSAMTDEILKNRGLLDKYIGDAIMAFWGAPVEEPEQAEKSLLAAIGMVKKLKQLNSELKFEGLPEIKIGIGISSGPAIVGNIGSELRLNYTAMGDTVNVASRLEGLTKEYKTEIIISETVKNKINNNYDFKFLGPVLVKGKEKPINIYSLTF